MFEIVILFHSQGGKRNSVFDIDMKRSIFIYNNCFKSYRNKTRNFFLNVVEKNFLMNKHFLKTRN